MAAKPTEVFYGKETKKCFLGKASFLSPPGRPAQPCWVLTGGKFGVSLGMGLAGGVGGEADAGQEVFW